MSESTSEEKAEWERALAGMRAGNPLATICQNCNGRHGPPRNQNCTIPPLPKDRP